VSLNKHIQNAENQVATIVKNEVGHFIKSRKHRLRYARRVAQAAQDLLNLCERLHTGEEVRPVGKSVVRKRPFPPTTPVVSPSPVSQPETK
jgi:predicted ABC-type ATPase